MKRILSIVLVCVMLMSCFSYANLENLNKDSEITAEGEAQLLNVTQKTAKKPVILVPGIGGTKLYSNNEFLWLDLWRAIFSASDDFLDPLKSSATGTTANLTGTIRAYNGRFSQNDINNGLLDGIILSINGDDIFEGLVSHLEQNGYTRGVNLFACPYDWRKDLNQEYNILDEVIEIAKQRSGWDQVDVVAHSMGGLLSKRYLVQNQTNRSKVDKFISLGTPYYGSPQALWALTVGDNFSTIFGIGVNPNKVKEMVKNYPSNYQLMPSTTYFNRIINSSAYNFDGVQYTSYMKESDFDFDGNGTKNSMMNYNEIGNAVYWEYNYYLYSRNNSLHNLLSGVALRDYGINHYVVAGSGLPTLYVMDVYNSWWSGRKFSSLKFGEGDETVPYGSAIETGTPATGKYYFPSDVKHGTMPSQGRHTVLSILNFNTSTNSFSTASVSTTNSKQVPEGVVEAISDEETPVKINGLMFLVRTEEMPLVYKKNNPSAKIGRGKDYNQYKPYLFEKGHEKNIKANENAKGKLDLVENTISKGSYIKQYGDIYVVYVPDAHEDYEIELTGIDTADIEIRKFDNSVETVLETVYDIDLKEQKGNKKVLEYNSDKRQLKVLE